MHSLVALSALLLSVCLIPDLAASGAFNDAPNLKFRPLKNLETFLTLAHVTTRSCYPYSRTHHSCSSPSHRPPSERQTATQFLQIQAPRIPATVPSEPQTTAASDFASTFTPTATASSEMPTSTAKSQTTASPITASTTNSSAPVTALPTTPYSSSPLLTESPTPISVEPIQSFSSNSHSSGTNLEATIAGIAGGVVVLAAFLFYAVRLSKRESNEERKAQLRNEPWKLFAAPAISVIDLDQPPRPACGTPHPPPRPKSSGKHFDFKITRSNYPPLLSLSNSPPPPCQSNIARPLLQASPYN